jgi:methyl-accepting chemotaxis protein
MIVVAGAGLIVAFIGAIAGWQMVGQLDRNSRRSLDVTVQTLDSFDDSITVAESVLTGTTATLRDVEASLAAVQGSFGASTEVATSVTELSDVLAPSLEDTVVALHQLEDVGTAIDTALGDLSALPLGPSYSPGEGLGATFGRIADDIEPLPEALRTTAGDLDAFQAALDDVRADVEALSSSVSEVNAAIADTDEVIASYRRNVADARRVTEDASADLESNGGMLRLLVVLGALVFAAGQIVPWWIGRELLDATERGSDVLGPGVSDPPTG